jgi:predicted branched-subunit amino acid permease
MKQQAYTFKEGLKDGIPIGLGYLSVSFGIGIAAVAAGLSPLIALIISMTNETSAGQKAGLDLITECLPLAEGIITMILSQLIINLRYSLMGISLSQRLDGSFTTPWRMLLSFSITDEIFAVASTKGEKVGVKYFAGLSTIPYVGWSLGTLLGALAGTLLPDMVRGCLGLMLFGMFIAIIIPPARRERGVLFAVCLAVALSCVFYFVPLFDFLSDGLALIISAVIAAVVAALVFPVPAPEDKEVGS